jgi:diguanylate cyclase (GGDEF)-like protein
MHSLGFYARIGGILLISLAAATYIQFVTRGQLDRAWRDHLAASDQKLAAEASEVSQRLQFIYENLRTISFLPSVRNIDRHATNLGADGRETIQQVYNNLVSRVSVSEVYILNENFNPVKVDDFTGKSEEPAVMFDEFIVQGGRFSAVEDPFATKNQSMSAEVKPGPEEVETEEFSQLVEHIAYFRANFAMRESFRGLSAPLISGQEVITCDNTEFNRTLIERDRKGLIFSVPFYTKTGQFGGMVSAIVRSNVIRSLSGDNTNVLESPRGEYATAAIPDDRDSGAQWSPSLFGESVPQKFSSKQLVKTSDPRGNWSLHNRHTSIEFYNSAEYGKVRILAFWSFTCIFFLTFIGLATVLLVRRKTTPVERTGGQDALTGLDDRESFDTHLLAAVAAAGRGSVAVLLLLDLDRFKMINDTIGHLAGDQILRETAARIKNCLGPDCHLSRLGGDEFAILVPHVEDSSDIRTLAMRMINAVEQPLSFQGQALQASVNIGIVAIADPNSSVVEILVQAELAVAMAKSSGKGGLHFYFPGSGARPQQSPRPVVGETFAAGSLR